MIRFLIWSNEHGGWWKPMRRGYTLDYREAGRYGHDDAELIVKDAGRYGPYGEHVPNEVAVLAPECRWQGGPPDPFDAEHDDLAPFDD